MADKGTTKNANMQENKGKVYFSVRFSVFSLFYVTLYSSEK